MSMTTPNRPYLLAFALLLAAAAALTIDVPVAHYAFDNWMFGDLRKFLDVTEVYAHGMGVMMILVTVWVLDPSSSRKLPRAAACAFGSGVIAQLAKQLLPRIRPNEFDYSGDVFSSFPGFWSADLDAVAGPVGRAIQSFPSGHAATAVGLAFALSWLYPRGKYLFAAIAVLAAVQRVEASAHFVSDTLVGAAIGCVIAGCCLDERLAGRWFSRFERAPGPSAAAHDAATPCG